LTGIFGRDGAEIASGNLYVNAGRGLLGRGCQLLFSDTFPAYSDTKTAKNNQSGKFHLRFVANVRSLLTAKLSPEKQSFPVYPFILSLIKSVDSRPRSFPGERGRE
jgi:hypothetical protein